MSKQNKTIYFVRHGQSVDNVEPVFQGVKSPLTKTGEKQATLIANRLVHIDFDTLIASPIKRAKQTAEKIAEATGKEITFSNLFVERIKPSSIAEGKPWTDKAAFKIWEEWGKTFSSNDPELKQGDGENYTEIVRRANDAFNYLLDRPEEKIVVVTHGYFLRVMIAHGLFDTHLTPAIMTQLQKRARTENTSITVMEYRDAHQEDYQWRLWTYNDHAHFAD